MTENTPEFILLDLEVAGGRPPFKARADEAREAVFSGRASLYSTQKTPPFWVLEELEHRFAHFDKLGPPTIDKKAFEQIDAHVFRNGLMQKLVKGQTLHWVSDLSELRNLVATILSDCVNRDQNVYAQATQVFEVFFHRQKFDQKPIDVGDQRYNRETYLISAGSASDGSGYPTDAYFIGEDWSKYNAKLNALDKKRIKLVMQSLIEGRILVSEKQGSGSVLVSPENSITELQNGPEFLYHFLLTKDLPPEWFYSPETLPSRISKAIRWLENAEKKLDTMGVRASQGDYTNILMRKFSLSMNAANEVWKRADRIHKDVSGNIPASIKAAKADLLEIEQDN